ncbi:lipid A export permease/ATP-binding protein MsbA [Pseudofulvimonas gallinarii]|uniref:Subfamily B ATP-binding cassette protein MsbA n=1 Tax=Pseudofulvimonas gallinarii TaxID=634155 RepID=A0A4S3L042_9GAMM|nr:lipid A export permease/ATP-binding protein MsbA [Pseudofulvimonas gallinarii]TCT01306.1 subfamily B ATP-binding cassette protein MsbA [Pseudofulvimonas gallinarii]THD15065.1 lipid A export permease/ATP-binding protein MsbA [Pseudofulvimonas gallinarii]
MTAARATPAAGHGGSAHGYGRLFAYTRPFWPVQLAAVTGMLVEAVAAGAFTWLMRPLIDGTFVDRDPGVLAWMPMVVVALFLVRGIGVFLSSYGMAYVGRRVVETLRGQTFAHLLRLPTGYYADENTARLVARLNFNAEQVADACAESLKVIVTDTLTVLALFCVMLYNSVSLTLTLVFMVPLIALVVWAAGKRFRSISRRMLGTVSDSTRVAGETLAGLDAVKVFGGEAAAEERYRVLSAQRRRLHLKGSAAKSLSTALVQLTAAIALAILIWIAGRGAMQGTVTAGTFISMMLAMSAMLPSLKRLTTVQDTMQKGLVAAESLFEILDVPVEADQGGIAIARATGRVEFRGVGLRYAGAARDALLDIDLVAEPGTVTAIVGRSGSGKSSLVRLLPRLLEPGTGTVLLDGRPLSDYSLTDLRRQIAWVSQQIVLFDDTVAANIAFGGLADRDDEQIRAAARAANALEFIGALPQGFQTRIGEGGASLSGGQRQRLAIARAILKDAPILILDEATSALDTESERLIQDALAHVMRDRTTFVIAHRLSTIEHADTVLVMDDGRIVERGTHRELLASGGVYASLHRMQFADGG